MAFEEIQEVWKIMADAAAEYLCEAYPDREISDNYDILVNAALRDMEENRPSGEQEYLLKLRDLQPESVM